MFCRHCTTLANFDELNLCCLLNEFGFCYTCQCDKACPCVLLKEICRLRLVVVLAWILMVMYQAKWHERLQSTKRRRTKTRVWMRSTSWWEHYIERLLSGFQIGTTSFSWIWSKFHRLSLNGTTESNRICMMQTILGLELH